MADTSDTPNWPAFSGEPSAEGQPEENEANASDSGEIETEQMSPVATVAEDTAPESEDHNLSLLLDVPLRISVELGRTSMTVEQVLAVGRGSVLELDRPAGDPVDILVNDRIIARGEVVVVDDYFGVRITELVRQDRGSGDTDETSQKRGSQG